MTSALTRLLIDGQWVDSIDGTTKDLVNPATETTIGPIAFGGRAEAEAAISAAASAFGAWAAKNPYERAAILTRAAQLIADRAEEYARITTEESGKPLAQSRAEWLSAPNYLVQAAEEAKRVGGRIIPARLPGRRIDVTYQPMGVIGVITAWNFPIYNVNRAVSSALAAGCSAVVRPSEFTPRSALAYGAALTDAGVPAGVVNVINGEPNAIAQAMLDDPRLRKIQFTGSLRVGRLLMEGAARTITKLSLELGGNAPVIVFPDVEDLEAVAESGVVAKYRNSGQVCISPQRFIVHSSIVEQFTKAAAAASQRQVVGDGMETETTVGPLINATQRDRVESIVDRSVAGGARVVVGGERPDRPGYFYTPTVMTDLPPGSPAASEEVFGPVLPILPFDTVDEAITLANSVEFGLASFVWTRDLRTAFHVSDALEFGLVGVNDWYPVTAEAPFGGMKQSGFGRESSTEGLLEYLEPKTRYVGGLA
jgi:acyl-CoA reductase-like NAD-dependent aldehyde dehydrogenase